MVYAAVDTIVRGGSGGGLPSLGRGAGHLPIAGAANTVLCVKLFGVASAVELFLFPCILLAAILFRPAERVVAAFVLLTPFIAYLGLESLCARLQHRRV
jgi:hypothetical protein